MHVIRHSRNSCTLQPHLLQFFVTSRSTKNWRQNKKICAPWCGLSHAKVSSAGHAALPGIKTQRAYRPLGFLAVIFCCFEQWLHVLWHQVLLKVSSPIRDIESTGSVDTACKCSLSIAVNVTIVTPVLKVNGFSVEFIHLAIIRFSVNHLGWCPPVASPGGPLPDL